MGKIARDLKIEIVKMELPFIIKHLETASSTFKKAADDWCVVNSCDGDKSKVEKPPVLTMVDGQVMVDLCIEYLRKLMRTMEQ